MAIPDYQSMMLPLLKFAGDQREHSISEAAQALGKEFRLTDDDRKELLPSGQPRFDNRVAWARTYLNKAGLLVPTRRGIFRITERGLQVLKSNPEKIGNKFLEQFPEFLAFRPPQRQDEKVKASEDTSQTQETPEELIESSYQNWRRLLAQELLQRAKACSPSFFEKLVVDLLVSMGYGGSRRDAGQSVGQTGDGGVDGIIKEDKLGLDVIYVQAKRWENIVGRPIVQGFAGSLEGHRARKGVLITTSRFSGEAMDYAEMIEKKIVLIDGDQLVQLMIDHGIGVADVASYSVKKLDADYFDEDE